jgi:hypothetical protein
VLQPLMNCIDLDECGEYVCTPPPIGYGPYHGQPAAEAYTIDLWRSFVTSVNTVMRCVRSGCTCDLSTVARSACSVRVLSMYVSVSVYTL